MMAQEQDLESRVPGDGPNEMFFLSGEILATGHIVDGEI